MAFFHGLIVKICYTYLLNCMISVYNNQGQKMTQKRDNLNNTVKRLPPLLLIFLFFLTIVALSGCGN